MREKIRALVRQAVSDPDIDIEIETPRKESFGDYSTNAAMIIAKKEKLPPAAVAEGLVTALRGAAGASDFESITSTPQGFINFKLNRRALTDNIAAIIDQGPRYGASTAGKGEKVLIEFVSANPTGPLHIGHGRWAVIGDVLANVLSFSGSRVDREFYVNDAGEQVKKLELSILARQQGKEIPEGGYAGEYVTRLAEKLKGDRDPGKDALALLLDEQKMTLESLGVKFDRWFFESELHRKGEIASA